jgi:two-component system, cell cycle response regulator DivK
MPTILIIEDDEMSRELVRDVLVFHGCHVLEAGSAENGLKILEEQGPLVVLLDIQLPGMDGFEMLNRIRSTEALSQTRVVAVTASAMDHDRRRIMAAGFDAYVPKPVNIDELVATVSRLAGSSTKHAGDWGNEL